MKKHSLSYYWHDRPAVTPAALLVCETRGAIVAGLKRVVHHAWALDYEFYPYGSFRVGSVRSPWRERQGRIAHLYRPNVVYWEDTREAGGRARHGTWINFAAGDWRQLDGLLGSDGCGRFRDAHGLLGSLLREASEIGHRRQEGGFWPVQQRLCAMVDLLLTAEPGEHGVRTIVADRPASGQGAFVASVHEFLGSRLFEPTTLEDVARALRVSRSTVAHRYRRETGKTPMTTLLQFRLDHAKALLLRGEPLRPIAAALCFSDEFHLSKAFKRYEGISPASFRRRSRTP